MSQDERRTVSNNKLLVSALKLISERGPTRMSLAEVGLAAGYSRGLAGERFGSRLGFMEALIDFTTGWIDERVVVAVAGKSGLDAVLARIACHIDAAVENPQFHRALYHLVVDSMWNEPGLRSSVNKMELSVRNGFVKHLREAQKRGDIAPHIDLSRQAILIVGTMRGVIIQALVADTPDVLIEMKAELLRMFRLSLRG